MVSALNGLGIITRASEPNGKTHWHLTERGKVVLVTTSALALLGICFALAATLSPVVGQFLAQNHRIIYIPCITLGAALALGGILAKTASIASPPPKQEKQALSTTTACPTQASLDTSPTSSQKLISEDAKHKPMSRTTKIALTILALAAITTLAVVCCELHLPVGEFLLHQNRFIYPLIGLTLTLCNHLIIKPKIPKDQRLKYIIISQIAIILSCVGLSFFMTTLPGHYVVSEMGRQITRPGAIGLLSASGLLLVSLIYYQAFPKNKDKLINS